MNSTFEAGAVRNHKHATDEASDTSQPAERSAPKPATFLLLLPEQSASYPLAEQVAVADMKSDRTQPQLVKKTTAAPVVLPAQSKPTPSSTSTLSAADSNSSRSSSISSDGHSFLRLGPVHWGGEPRVGDYAENA